MFKIVNNNSKQFGSIFFKHLLLEISAGIFPKINIFFSPNTITSQNSLVKIQSPTVLWEFKSPIHISRRLITSKQAN
jgi:hypothetical protein